MYRKIIVVIALLFVIISQSLFSQNVMNAKYDMSKFILNSNGDSVLISNYDLNLSFDATDRILNLKFIESKAKVREYAYFVFDCLKGANVKLQLDTLQLKWKILNKNKIEEILADKKHGFFEYCNQDIHGYSQDKCSDYLDYIFNEEFFFLLARFIQIDTLQQFNMQLREFLPEIEFYVFSYEENASEDEIFYTIELEGQHESIVNFYRTHGENEIRGQIDINKELEKYDVQTYLDLPDEKKKGLSLKSYMNAIRKHNNDNVNVQRRIVEGSIERRIQVERNLNVFIRNIENVELFPKFSIVEKDLLGSLRFEVSDRFGSKELFIAKRKD